MEPAHLVSTLVMGSITYRIRGTAKPYLGTQGGRVLWALPAACLVWGYSENIYMGLLAWLLMWIGAIPGYFGGQFNLEKMENLNPENYARLTMRGAFFSVPLCAGLLIANIAGYYPGQAPIGGIIAGMLYVPCYIAGMAIEPFIKQRFYASGDMMLGGFILTGIALTL